MELNLWQILLIIIILIIIGFYIYKLFPYTYTPNIAPFWKTLFVELDSIQLELKDINTTEEKKKELLIRQDEIYNILSQFFGYKIDQENAGI